MKFHVYKTVTGLWRFTNFHNIGGDSDSWEEAFLEAFWAATVHEVTA